MYANIRIKPKIEKELKGERNLQFNPNESMPLYYIYVCVHTHIYLGFW